MQKHIPSTETLGPVVRGPLSRGPAQPRPGSIAAQAAARRNSHALLNLDHSIRSLALKHGAEEHEAEALVLEARRVFTINNALPVARDPNGDLIPGENGYPLTPEQWLHSRLAN